jgi:hypothetical protein
MQSGDRGRRLCHRDLQAQNSFEKTDDLVGSQHDRVCRGKSLTATFYSGVGHERDQIEWVDEFFIETRKSPPIEPACEGTNSEDPDDISAYIKPMFHSDIDRHKFCAECESIIWQHINVGTPLHRVKDSRTCIRPHADNTSRFSKPNSR